MKNPMTRTIYRPVLLVCILLLSVASVSADDEQYSVTTSVTKKNILLEEFTGVYCGNCPDAHAVTATLLTATPKAFAIQNHSGYYATPRGDEVPDYRTEGGEEIEEYFGVTSFPTGTINRRAFEPLALISGRGDWIPCSKLVVEEDAPVNLLLTSFYDGATRDLTIRVEGYYTAEEQAEDQELTVVWTQSNIIGPQNGVSGDYVHKNMLRGFFSDVWGDTLVSPKQGEYFVKEYYTSLPESVRDVEVNPEDIQIIAFVTNGKENVLNVAGGKPIYNNYEKPLGGSLSSAKLPIGTYYSYKFFELTLTNSSDKAITEASFDIDINGTIYESTWSGEIPSFESQEIVVPCDYEQADGSSEYCITLVKINGETVSQSSLSGSFYSPIASTPTLVANLKTNREVIENHYYVKDVYGEVVLELGPYENGVSAEYEETIELDPQEVYAIEITDEWGDGIYSPRGNFTTHSSDGSLIYQLLDIADFGYRYFICTSKENPDGITSVNTMDGSQEVDIYGLDGIKLYSGKSDQTTLVPGVYILRDKTTGKTAKRVFK